MVTQPLPHRTASAVADPPLLPTAGDICGLADALFTSTHVTGAVALEEVHALEVTRQELHTVISGYPVLRREFTRVARQTVEALGLPITLPQSEEEAKQEGESPGRARVCMRV